MRTLVLCITFLLSFVFTNAAPTLRPKNDYIERYHTIALTEKKRGGIPASITLGQGILESSWGEGALAKDGNNHFGIKCHDWTKSSFYLNDDDYNQEGILVPSCFRSYESAEESFVDHTDFLVARKRYQGLFSIEEDNYREWAFGLKEAGYATDSAYAYKLIRIIESYELWKYDGLKGPIAAGPNENAFEDFTNNQFAIPKERFSEPLKDSELFEFSPGVIEHENAKENIQVSDYEVPKSFRLPEGYVRGQGRKIFNQAIKKAKEWKSSNKSSEEYLDTIVPEKEEELRARGVNEATQVIKERKVKSNK